MTKSSQALLVFLAMLMAQPLPTQDAEYVLGEIVVKSDKPGVDDVTSVLEVTAEDIEIRGATTLNETIAMLHGVYSGTAS